VSWNSLSWDGHFSSFDRNLRESEGIFERHIWYALASPASVACPVQPHAPAALWSGRYLRTIGHGGQGVDASAA
jgi:hypothetical protein